ncbi:glycosyltransferase family 4 protein [Ferruginibacter sp. SUN106]|uniref:glycosyltransferase family 4 protein n=1 Tax=Ferruginibacter sp. SUN106 TaxID=2978348 RepID=UPI003D35B300
MHSVNDTLIILTPGFPSSVADTTCLPLQQSFVKHFKELYPKTNIIVLSFHYPFTKTTYNWYGATIISFNGHNKRGVHKLLLRRSIQVTLKRINRTNRVTGVLSFWYGECALTGNWFARKYNCRHYCWLFGQDARKENKYPRRVQLNPNRLIALSDFLQDEFENNHGIKPLHVIPSGVDVKQFAAAAKEKNIDILGAGSLIALKRYDQFIGIVAAIKKERPAVKAMLIGDGPEKENLKTLISKYDLQDNIVLTGELPHEMVLQLMQHSIVFLHPSSYEGFSGVCLEALGSGAIVISFCRAMYQDIDHWHIVNTTEEMTQKALAALQNTNSKIVPQFPFVITATVKAVARLYNYS